MYVLFLDAWFIVHRISSIRRLFESNSLESFHFAALTPHHFTALLSCGTREMVVWSRFSAEWAKHKVE